MITSFYAEDELARLGLKAYGTDVQISRKCSIYSPETISIGDNVRIDDFCLLSGVIRLGSHIHISAYSAIYGNTSVVMEDYTGVSQRVTIYSAMDDFSGDYLIGPVHEKIKTRVIGGEVRLCKFSHIGASSIVFPNVQIGEGTVVGAFSLVTKSLPEWGIYAGIPVTFRKKRSQKLLKIFE